MGNDAAWVPNRAALKKRMERALDLAQTPTGRQPVQAPELGQAGSARTSNGAVRSLSTRIDQLAVEQFRGVSRLQSELQEVRRALTGLGLGQPVLNEAVEVCPIQDMLIGFPAQEWRLIAYCRYRGAPEPGALRRFRDLAQPGMCVADVGANVGLFTIAAAIEVGSNGRVFSYEPTPRTHSILQQNIQLNGLLESGHVSIEQVALSDRAGRTQFGLHHSNSGHNSLYASHGVDQVIEVRSRTLDDAVPERRLDLVKIDAEGAEPAILRGMKRHIARNPRIKIIAEFAPRLLRRAGADPVSFLGEIKKLGMQYSLIAEPDGELATLEADRLLELESANLLLTRVGTA